MSTSRWKKYQEWEVKWPKMYDEDFFSPNQFLVIFSVHSGKYLLHIERDMFDVCRLRSHRRLIRFRLTRRKRVDWREREKLQLNHWVVKKPSSESFSPNEFSSFFSDYSFFSFFFFNVSRSSSLLLLILIANNRCIQTRKRNGYRMSQTTMYYW